MIFLKCIEEFVIRGCGSAAPQLSQYNSRGSYQTFYGLNASGVSTRTKLINENGSVENEMFTHPTLQT